MIRQELQEFHEFMEFHYKQCFGPCIVRVSVSTGIFCLTNLLAEVQARIASLARGKKRGRAVAGEHVAQRKQIVIASFGNPKPRDICAVLR